MYYTPSSTPPHPKKKKLNKLINLKKKQGIWLSWPPTFRITKKIAMVKQ